MATFKINANEAKAKHVPDERESAEILDYLKSRPNDNEAIPHLMGKYNCTYTSIMRIVMLDAIE